MTSYRKNNYFSKIMEPFSVRLVERDDIILKGCVHNERRL